MLNIDTGTGPVSQQLASVRELLAAVIEAVGVAEVSAAIDRRNAARAAVEAEMKAAADKVEAEKAVAQTAKAVRKGGKGKRR